MGRYFIDAYNEMLFDFGAVFKKRRNKKFSSKVAK